MINNLFNEKSAIIRLITSQGLIDSTTDSWGKVLSLLKKERDNVVSGKMAEILPSEEMAPVIAALNLSIKICEDHLEHFQNFIDLGIKAHQYENKIVDKIIENRDSGNN